MYHAHLDTILLLIYDKLSPQCGKFMKFLSAKKLILIGFIVVLLIGIPLAIYLVQQQQQTQSEAQQATTLSFEPTSTQNSPIEAAVNEPISLDIVVDPGAGQNLVSFVRLDIQYDPTVLAPVEQTDTLTPFEVNDSALSLLEGPVYSEGNISATLSVGVDPTKVIQTRTTIATVTFLPIANSQTPTEVSYTTTSQVLSAGAGETANENVLVGTEPAFIQIGESAATGSASPTATPSASTTPQVTATPSGSTNQTASPSATPSPTVSSGTGQSSNQLPICESLTSTSDTTGVIPFNVNLNVQGSDANGTITQATFSFGDGQVQNLTSGGGITTSSVNLNVAHTYTNSGNYTASVVLTDNNGGVSTGSCSIEIVALTSTDQVTNPTATPVPNAELMDTGPGEIMVVAGVAVGILTFLGAALFFFL